MKPLLFFRVWASKVLFRLSRWVGPPSRVHIPTGELPATVWDTDRTDEPLCDNQDEMLRIHQRGSVPIEFILEMSNLDEGTGMPIDLDSRVQKFFLVIMLNLNSGLVIEDAQRVLSANLIQWCRLANNVWLVHTAHSPAWFSNHLKSLAHPSGSLFISRLDTRDHQGWLPAPLWNWMEAVQHSQEKEPTDTPDSGLAPTSQGSE